MNFDGSAHTANRGIGLVVVAVFHVVLVWVLMTQLAHKTFELPPPPIETKIIEETKKPPPEPPPPAPEIVLPPPPFIPPPEINIAKPVETPKAITTAPVPPPTPTPPAPSPVISPVPAPPAPKAITRVAPKLDLPNSPKACREPEYPAASSRLGEEGTTSVSLLIGPDGAVQQTRIDQSSGSKRLDEATIKAFSKCKFINGTTDGKAEASWFSIRYKWNAPQ